MMTRAADRPLGAGQVFQGGWGLARSRGRGWRRKLGSYWEMPVQGGQDFILGTKGRFISVGLPWVDPLDILFQLKTLCLRLG